MDRGNFFSEVALRIATYRKEKGYTQARLADLAGLAEKHVAAIEQGNAKPSLNTVYSICKGLGIRAEELFKGL
jgi:DNA-binding XRE family transcriptional regulator